MMLGALALSAVVGLLGAELGLEVSGRVVAEGRFFFQAPRHLGQRLGSGPSIAMQPQVYLQDGPSRHTLSLEPFLRVDAIDSARTHYDLRRADYVFATGGWTLGLGVGTFTSGVLEGHRAVDVVNQRDLVEDIDGHVKLGQPYLGIGYGAGAWSFSFQYLPYFRHRTFPGERGRLRFPLVVDGEQALYESKFARWHPSFSARASVSVGDFDAGLSGFSGLSREPRFFAQLSRPGVVAPQYDLLQQAAIDAQWTAGSLLLKAEGAVRLWSADLQVFFAGGAGAEYDLYDVFGTGIDCVVLVEYHHDNRPKDAPLTFFDHEAVAGLRVAINDTGSTTFGSAVVVDVLTGTVYGRASLQRSFAEHWRARLEGRVFFGPQDGAESGLLNDNYAQGSLSYFF